MKLVVAVIQPQQLPAVKRALFDAGIRHLTVTNVLGTAAEGADVLLFRGVPREVSLYQKVRIELPLREDMVERALEAVTRGANDSGGFGIAFVLDLEEFVVLRSGLRGDRAVQ